MSGTWVNVVAIVLGSLIGLLLKRGIPERINSALFKTQGLVVLIIGINGVIGSMFTVDVQTGKLKDSGTILLLISMVVGCVIGELLRIEDRLNQFGDIVEKRAGGSGFSKGFITASLIFSVGAMAVVGALNDGLKGDSSILFTKSLLDFTTAVVLTAALGFGVAFSAIPVLLVQGSISLLAGFLAPLISDQLLTVFCMVGYALVACIGFNFLCDSKIRVANLLPALVFPVIYHFLFQR